MEIELFQGAADDEALHFVERAEAVARIGQNFTQGRRVADFVAPPGGPLVVRVRLRDASATLILQRRMQITITNNYVVTIDLDRGCRNVMCPGAGDVVGNTECLGGHCVDPRCNPADEATYEFCPQVEFCNAVADCTREVSSCAEQVCSEGICVEAPIENACTSMQYCDPDVGAGCTQLPIYDLDAGPDATMNDGGDTDSSVDDSGLDGGVDAGVDDAGLDATMDAEMPDAGCRGELRSRPGNPCIVEFYDCSLEPPIWREITRSTPGASCGMNAVCNASSECIACSAGATCSSGCFLGITRCESGTPECDFSTSPIAESGALCDQTGAYCFPGESLCTFDGACDGDGNCMPCVEGSDCVTSDCHTGTRSCSAGSAGCIATASYADAGAQCGSYSVCSSSHLCNFCVPNAACAPSDLCMRGTTDCTSGMEVCTPDGPQVAGTWCGDNQVCNGAGLCEDCIAGFQCDRANECEAGTLTCYAGRTCNAAGPKPPGGACSAGVCSGFSTCYPETTDVEQVSAGRYFTCALRTDGHVTCFSDNGSGQLGQGTTSAVGSHVNVIGLTNATQIASSYSHTCAVREDGGVSCWGANGDGQLGDGTTMTRSTPINVSLPRAAVGIAVNWVSSCALLDDGTVICWGWGQNLGTGSSANHFTPGPLVAGASNIVQIASGGNHTCARRDDGHVLCWGLGNMGAIGTGVVIPGDGWAYSATEVITINDAVDIAVGVRTDRDQSCAVRSSGELWCWGSNWYGSIGDPTMYTFLAPTRAALGSVTDVVDVEMAGAYSLVRTSAGTVISFGTNYSGGLGRTSVTTLGYMLNVSDAAGMGVGIDHSCIIRESGQLLCTGANDAGQLGDGTVANRSTVVAVRGP